MRLQTERIWTVCGLHFIPLNKIAMDEATRRMSSFEHRSSGGIQRLGLTRVTVQECSGGVRYIL